MKNPHLSAFRVALPTSRSLALVLLACLALAPLAGLGVAEEQGAAEAPAASRMPTAEGSSVIDDALPLTSVTLYSSGVGHFVHDGMVEGDVTLALSVPISEVNDLLKSLVLQDLDGGTIGVVRYGSREPMERALRSYAVDLSENPTVAGILTQARGEQVEIVAERVLVGAIVSVTTSTEVEEGVRRDVVSVNVNTAEGLQSIRMSEIRRVRFLRPALQAELEQAISILARDRQTDTRDLMLDFRGDGRRRVRIGYVRRTPVWKTSYRLVLDGPSQIQGWAIVENTTSQDWRDVSLSLVTGAPISFTMNLYDPVYVERPDIPPPVRSAVGPQVYDQDLAATIAPPSRARSYAAPMAEALDYGESEERFDLSQGVREQSVSRDLGTAFAYDVAERVSIERYASALVPIIIRSIDVEEISIYDPAVHASRPLLGAEISNSTSVHLTPGPVTVFDGTAYAGDARIGDVAPGSSTFVSFAVDLDVEVSTSSSPLPEEIREVSIIRGTLEASHVSRRTAVYTVVNRGREARQVVIQHPKSQGWRLRTPMAPDSETDADYRFRVEVAPGAREELVVETELVRSQTYVLSSLDSRRITIYIESGSVNPAIRAALRRVIELQAAVNEAVQARQRIETEIQQIHRDQERIRANMESLDRDSRLYERYVSTLDEQEDQLQSLKSRLEQATTDELAARQALERYLTGLTVS